jgi:hypothetical protein
LVSSTYYALLHTAVFYLHTVLPRSLLLLYSNHLACCFQWSRLLCVENALHWWHVIET